MEDKIIIAIPTCSEQRFDSLVQTVESIQAGNHKNVHPVIVADGNPRIYERAHKSLRHVTILLNKERIDWNASVNRVLREFDAPYYIYASDDLIFPENCIEAAMATMKEKFPDGFGLVTIGKKVRTAFGLIGLKFADHFPSRQVMCPDLIHYGADSELQRAVQELGNFAFPPDRTSQVKHFRNKDDTWRLARKIRTRDHRIYYQRMEKGLIWGVDFELLTNRGITND